MNIFDKLKAELKLNEEGNTENVGKVVSEKATDIIKQLSGVGVKGKKKIIDNVILFTGASGGCGASTVATNVAYTINKMGFKVLLIDLNILYPNQHMSLGVEQRVEVPDLCSYLLGKNPLGESINTKGDISLLFANNRSLGDFINCEADGALDNLEEGIDHLRQLFDLVIIDSPMKLENALVNTAMYLADKIYLVWDESIGSILNTEKIRLTMAISGIDCNEKLSIILNKRTSVGYSNYPFKSMKLKLTQVLPFDVSIISSGLKTEIFCKSGASNKETANVFYKGILQLSNKILEAGGYIK